MRRARWLAPWKDSREKPALYHCISRVVERRLAFGPVEKERFRVLMRAVEDFSGCRVLSYCVMSNHFHLLLEVPAPPHDGISDQELLGRLSAIYPPSVVSEIAQELSVASSTADPGRRSQIHARYAYRMHDLGEFMKTLLQRFTQWFNGRHRRTGRLWEDRFKSVIVEGGIAARTIAAYIDLNPVRAGLAEDPAKYRWSGYGEAIGCGSKEHGKKAREGLVRACMSHEGEGYESERWKDVAVDYRRLMGYALQRRPRTAANRREFTGRMADHESRTDTSQANHGFSGMLRHRVRYFTDGAVIGSKEFVNGVFAAARNRFTERRADGARRMRGQGKPAAGVLWSVRDLRVRI